MELTHGPYWQETHADYNPTIHVRHANAKYWV